jgi:hypothetical protein
MKEMPATAKLAAQTVSGHLRMDEFSPFQRKVQPTLCTEAAAIPRDHSLSIPAVSRIRIHPFNCHLIELHYE